MGVYYKVRTLNMLDVTSKYIRKCCASPLICLEHSYIQLVLKYLVPLDRSFATSNQPLNKKPIQEQFDMIQPVPVNVVIEYRFLWGHLGEMTR